MKNDEDRPAALVSVEDGKPTIAVTPRQQRQISGSTSPEFGMWLVRGMMTTRWRPKSMSDADDEQQISAMMVALRGFAARDEVEGMMAAQAVTAHAAVIECQRRAMLPDQPFEAAAQLRKQAASLSRNFIELVAALDRRNGRSMPQVFRVERVQIAPGGQAVLGNVNVGAQSSERREGAAHGTENEGEPHAPPARLAHDAAPGPVLPPLRSANPVREPVQVTRDEQRSVPNARRGKHRA